MKTSSVGPLSPEFAILGFLAQGEAHGYELHQRLAQELGQIWHLSLSQIYNILNRLEEQGLIAGVIQEGKKLPARRVFHITSTGRQRFDEWLYTPSNSSVRAIRVEFTTRLYFAFAADPAQATRMITEQSNEIQAALKRLLSTQESIANDQIFNRLGLELRIRQLTSILDWLKECQTRLGGKY